MAPELSAVCRQHSHRGSVTWPNLAPLHHGHTSPSGAVRAETPPSSCGAIVSPWVQRPSPVNPALHYSTSAGAFVDLPH
jgi:hypothetical protein